LYLQKCDVGACGNGADARSGAQYARKVLISCSRERTRRDVQDSDSIDDVLDTYRRLFEELGV